MYARTSSRATCTTCTCAPSFDSRFQSNGVRPGHGLIKTVRCSKQCCAAAFAPCALPPRCRTCARATPRRGLSKPSASSTPAPEPFPELPTPGACLDNCASLSAPDASRRPPLSGCARPLAGMPGKWASLHGRETKPRARHLQQPVRASRAFWARFWAPPGHGSAHAPRRLCRRAGNSRCRTLLRRKVGQLWRCRSTLRRFLCKHGNTNRLGEVGPRCPTLMDILP